MMQQLNHYQELIQHRNHQIVRWFVVVFVLSVVGTTAGYRHWQYVDWILRVVCMFGIGFLAAKVRKQFEMVKRSEHLISKLEQFDRQDQ